jgi:TldD protein
VKRVIVTALALSLLPAPSLLAQGKDKKPADSAGTSRAVTTEVLDAIAEEMNRASQSMEIPGAPPPYLIQYKVTEVEVNDVVASLGSVTDKKDRHFVQLQSWVHVGDYQNDNTNYYIPRTDIDGSAAISLPVEADPRTARRATWLATDQAFKEALQQLLAKRETRRAGTSAPTGVDSYSKGKSVVSEEPVVVPRLEKLEDMAARAETISAVFRNQAHIRDSRVAFTSFLERRWYLNTEGTNATDTRRVSGVIIAATAQAADGQELALYFSRYGHTAADLPDDEALVAEARKLVATMAELRKAPLAENYTGPVLFEGRAAGEVVRHTLTQHLGGTPLPEGLPPDQAKRFGGALNERIGFRVLSPVLTLVDDPTATHAGKQALIGGYRFDDEGTEAQRVEVVDKGQLETLLMSRTPSKQIASSNGHARREAPGGAYHGSATNVFIEGRGGLSQAALRRKLLAEARAQGLEYAIIIRGFDDAAVTAAPELATREILSMLETTDRDEPPPAALAYRVYPNGREELIRGVQLEPVTMRAWRDLIAVGRNDNVYNYLASGQEQVVHKVIGVQEGFVPSSGVESAVVTPDLLFQELDVGRSTIGMRPEPAVPPPTTAK